VDDEVSSVRRLSWMVPNSVIEPMAPTRRMIAIDDDLLALARGEEVLSPSEVPSIVPEVVPSVVPSLVPSLAPASELDPFGGLEPVFEDSASLLPPSETHYDEEEALSLSWIPRMAVDDRMLATFPLDHRHGFVLCRIDGKRTIREIVDQTGLPEEKVLPIVSVLLELGIIELT